MIRVLYSGLVTKYHQFSQNIDTNAHVQFNEESRQHLLKLIYLQKQKQKIKTVHCLISDGKLNSK